MDKMKQMAMNVLGEITFIDEKSNAVIFYNDNLRYDGCVVIMKNNYKLLTMTEYILLMGDEINDETGQGHKS